VEVRRRAYLPSYLDMDLSASLAIQGLSQTLLGHYISQPGSIRNRRRLGLEIFIVAFEADLDH
jgi:hypothetical protein